MSAPLVPRGEFSLAAAAAFAEVFPATEAERADDGMRLAWAVDGDWRTVAATLSQDAAGVHVVPAGGSPAELTARARADVERILCLDVDGSGFAAVGERDPVVGELQRRLPGLRPVRALAAAALAGRLGRERLRAMGRAAALADLCELPGIGPFSSELVWIRGVGDPDALPAHERRYEQASRNAYGTSDAGRLGRGRRGLAPLQGVGDVPAPERLHAGLMFR